MGFTIEHVVQVTFQPCEGWPKPVDWRFIPDYVSILEVVNGKFHCHLVGGDLDLDNPKLTGYICIEYSQDRLIGYSEERKEKNNVIEENRKKVIDASKMF